MAVYTLPDLAYDYGALEPHIVGQIMELHHGKHHAAYVKGANTTLEQLEAARAKNEFSTINQLEKHLAFHVSGHKLHSLFWANLTPKGGGEPHGSLGDELKRAFGSFGAFQQQFTQASLGVQGSGWGVLAWEPMAGQLVVVQVHDHQGEVAQGMAPLLVCDMWEHAYYLQYRNQKADFVQAFWRIVHWDDVASRLQQAKQCGELARA